MFSKFARKSNDFYICVLSVPSLHNRSKEHPAVDCYCVDLNRKKKTENMKSSAHCRIN